MEEEKILVLEKKKKRERENAIECNSNKIRNVD